jgi:hypothetical protein
MEMLFPRKRLSILINTGVPDPSNRLSFRLVAGVWSLAAFIFVQAYTSTLITYVVTPVNPPLVSSAYDLVDKKDINVLVRKSGAIDTMFSASISNSDSVICFTQFPVIVELASSIKTESGQFKVTGEDSTRQNQFFSAISVHVVIGMRQVSFSGVKKHFHRCKVLIFPFEPYN